MIPPLPTSWKAGITSLPGAVAGNAIEVRDLTKLYGATRGVDRLSLVVPCSSIYGVLGPNGSGKTTTIRILLDLVARDGGEVSVLGQDPAKAGPRLRASIGYLPGELGLPDTMTAMDAIRLYGDLSGGGSPLRDWIMEVLDLSPSVLGGKLRYFSKGMKQKVGIVQAVQHGPSLLILDEPTTGLDPVIQARFFAGLIALRQAGVTVFLSSHILGEVQSLCDRVAILKQGRLAQEGPVSQVLVTGNRRLFVSRSGPHVDSPPKIDGAEPEQPMEGALPDPHWWTFRTTAEDTIRVIESLHRERPDDFRLESLVEESFLELYNQSASERI